MMRKVMLGCGLALLAGTFSQGAVAMMTDEDEGVSAPVYHLNPAEEEMARERARFAEEKIARERARFDRYLGNVSARKELIDEWAAYPLTSPVRNVILREIMNRLDAYLFLNVRAAIALPQDDAERNAFLAENASAPFGSYILRSQATQALPDGPQKQELWRKFLERWP